ncbi:MAG: type II toxin-antitoxin system VapC family toxin [Alphaproteobacteria bacterium]|nr:type II toxin-antitoxin system VapC family toxin [Alphaproteobacteria bacterium]
MFLNSVTVWEIALRVDLARIELDLPVDARIERFLDRRGVAAVPLAHSAAARSCALHHFEHRDPADRLLIATAIVLGCPLVTYDARIVQFAKKRGRQQGFSVDVVTGYTRAKARVGLPFAAGTMTEFESEPASPATIPS